MGSLTPYFGGIAIFTCEDASVVAPNLMGLGLLLSSSKSGGSEIPNTGIGSGPIEVIADRDVEIDLNRLVGGGGVAHLQVRDLAALHRRAAEHHFEDVLPLVVGNLAQAETHTELGVTASRGIEVDGELASVVQGAIDAASVEAFKGKVRRGAHQSGSATGREGESFLVAQRRRQHAEGGDAVGAVEPDLLTVNRDAGDDVIELRRRRDVRIEFVLRSDQDRG